METGGYGHFPSWVHPKEDASLNQTSLEERPSTLTFGHLLSRALGSLEEPACLCPHWKKRLKGVTPNFLLEKVCNKN